MNTTPKGPFLGINTRLPDFALNTENGSFLRGATNVLVDNAGWLRRRKATTLHQAMAAPDSIHLDASGVGYMSRNGVIYAVTMSPYSETVFKVLTSSAPVSWLEFNGSLYYSNGTDSGRIVAGVWLPMAFPTPVSPTVTSLPGGMLYAGWYQVAVSYYNATTGEEGGISPSSNYQLAADGGVRVTLPAATSGATHINVYCSLVNGSIPMLCASVPVGTATYDVIAPGAGREATQRYDVPLPAGRLFLFNGCLCSYNGTNVYEGLPFRPGYYLPVEGRIPFPTTVTNVVPTRNGVYIVADETYWLQGKRMTECEDVKRVLPFGGVPNTEFAIEHEKTFGWFSTMGFVIATQDGTVHTPMVDTAVVTPPASGHTVVLSSGELRLAVSCGWCINLKTKTTTQFSDYDFTSDSHGYATRYDGIHKLETTGNVDYRIDFGKEDFGAEELKHLLAVYAGGESAVAWKLEVTDNQRTRTYTSRTYVGHRKHRFDPGRGLQANWFSFSLLGTAEFVLSSLSFVPVASTRRI